MTAHNFDIFFIERFDILNIENVKNVEISLNMIK